jgi:hypothetical protein
MLSQAVSGLEDLGWWDCEACGMYSGACELMQTMGRRCCESCRHGPRVSHLWQARTGLLALMSARSCRLLAERYLETAVDLEVVARLLEETSRRGA